jgi:catalase
MGKERMARASGKRKQPKGPVLNGESKVTAGGELHQIAGGEHPR